MDYGQNKQKSSATDLITDGMTSGVGLQSEHANALPTEENLNTDIFGDHDYSSIGNTALQSHFEYDPSQSKSIETSTEPQTQPHQEMELAPPPIKEPDEPPMNEASEVPSRSLGAEFVAR